MRVIETSASDTSGEPFTEEEAEEMMAAAMDPDKKTITYDEHVTALIVEEQS